LLDIDNMQYKLKKNLPSLYVGTLFDMGNSSMHGDYLMNSNDGFTIIMYLKNIKNFDEWFEKVKWEPEEKELFYCMDSRIKLTQTNWKNTTLNIARYEAGNCFKTEKECQDKINQIKQILCEK